MSDAEPDNEQELSDSMDSATSPQLSELLLGEITAALASDSRSSLDELPAPLAERAALVGEAMVRVQRTDETAKPLPLPRIGSRARDTMLWSGWLAAAAMLAVFVGTSRPAANPPASSGAPVALRDSLMSADSTLLRADWVNTDDPSAVGARGDVMWSARAQRGVMRIAGLAANDPTRWQYQLWIFDRSRDERYPVDGGVFDIPAGESDVFITMDPAVVVGDATLFAVTVEPAGGVVVSTRERIVLTAGL